MKRLSLLTAVALMTLAPACAADEEAPVQVYFGGAYEVGELQFKQGIDYANAISGWSPIIGIEIGKHFAIEGTWLLATGSKAQSDVLTYHSSARGGTLELVVRLPLGDSGFTPFLGGGFSFMKMKELTRTPFTNPATQKATTVYTALVNKTEINPMGAAGLSYTYGGIEVRGYARLQPINMENSGQYFLSYGGGLIFHV